MAGATELVRRLYEAYQERDWDAAAELLHPEATVAMPDTRELLVGRDGVIAFQRDYPEPWGELTVRRVLGRRDEAAAEIEVVAPDETFGMAAFWRTDEGLLRDGVEYWVAVGGSEPPPYRRVAGTGR
jgi:ketosteroid isomerase-like protein